MTTHMNLHALSPLAKPHFDRWKKLFLETIDEYFEGSNAELAKQRAVSIATMMQIKIIEGATAGFNK